MLWSNIIYISIVLVVCMTLWKLTSDSEHLTLYTLYTSNSTYSYPVHSLHPGDYHQLINISNFTFTILNYPCNDSIPPLLLVLIHANPKNFEKRMMVRKTWGQNNSQVKTLFLMGLIQNQTIKTQVDKENEEFGDIIQGSFIDAYRNMTYKHVMVFKYAIYHCPRAKYILKTDDDVFVNMPLMLNFLTKDLSPFGGSRMLFCRLLKKARASRSWRSKWRVTFQEYRGKTYPTYCPGFALLYSQDVVFDLYREAQRSDFFWIDDVHITGTLAGKIGLSQVNIDRLVLTPYQMFYATHQPSTFNRSFLFGAPNMEDINMENLWEVVKKQQAQSLVDYLEG